MDSIIAIVMAAVFAGACCIGGCTVCCKKNTRIQPVYLEPVYLEPAQELIVINVPPPYQLIPPLDPLDPPLIDPLIIDPPPIYEESDKN